MTVHIMHKCVAGDSDHPDYYPLTHKGIEDLMDIVETTTDLQTICSVQIRLNQAIPEITCPHPITGPVAMRLDILNHIFIEALERRWPRKILTAFLAILCASVEDQCAPTS